MQKKLNVELILADELNAIKDARAHKTEPLNYSGNLMKILTYNYIKKQDIIDSLPDTYSEIEKPNIYRQFKQNAEDDVYEIQCEYDVINDIYNKAHRDVKKSIDKISAIILRGADFYDCYMSEKNKQEKTDKPTIKMGDG